MFTKYVIKFHSIIVNLIKKLKIIYLSEISNDSNQDVVINKTWITIILNIDLVILNNYKSVFNINLIYNF